MILDFTGQSAEPVTDAFVFNNLAAYGTAPTQGVTQPAPVLRETVGLTGSAGGVRPAIGGTVDQPEFQ